MSDWNRLEMIDSPSKRFSMMVVINLLTGHFSVKYFLEES